MQVSKLLVAMLLLIVGQCFGSQSNQDHLKNQSFWWNVVVYSKYQHDGKSVDVRVSDCCDREMCSKCCLGCCACSALIGCYIAGVTIQGMVRSNLLHQDAPKPREMDQGKNKNN